MAVHFFKTSSFEKAREKIENHLYDSVSSIERNEDLALKSVAKLSESIERFFDTLEQMYQTPHEKDTSGERSFPIHEGRYRVFFKIVVEAENFNIYLLDIDDNRQSNLDRFPVHKLINFVDEK